LLLSGEGLVKTVNFGNPVYVGDPINTIKIFNEKEVDELVFLDISATRESKKPPFDKLEEIASECFMPIGYGGGIRSLDEMKQVFGLGFEKVILNSATFDRPTLLTEAADTFGSQSVVASIDYRRNWLGRKQVFVHCGKKRVSQTLVEYARLVESLGAGEILLTSIDREGTFTGYDIASIREISDAVDIPVVAHGGAGTLNDVQDAIVRGGASAAAAGSIFVFHGKHRAVLVNYPERSELDSIIDPSGAFSK